jgi:AraC-like DNA-binding protein
MAVDKPVPQLGVVGRAGTGAVFDLMRSAPSNDAATWVEHFWSVSWDLRGREPFDVGLFGGPVTLDHDRERAAARLDAAIAASQREPDSTFGTLTGLLDRIAADATLHRVEQVMEPSPWSTRTTQRVFRRYVGVPVKWVLCRYRLQHAALELESDPTVDGADLAVRLG